MIHRTPGRLDEPPRFFGFSFAQWALTLAAAAAVYGAGRMFGLPIKVTLTLLAFLVGTPAISLALAETGGPKLGQLLLDAIRFLHRRRALLRAGAGERHVGVLLSVELSPEDDQVVPLAISVPEIPWE